MTSQKNLIRKDILDVIHNLNMQSNLNMNKK